MAWSRTLGKAIERLNDRAVETRNGVLQIVSQDTQGVCGYFFFLRGLKQPGALDHRPNRGGYGPDIFGPSQLTERECKIRNGADLYGIVNSEQVRVANCDRGAYSIGTRYDRRKIFLAQIDPDYRPEPFARRFGSLYHIKDGLREISIHISHYFINKLFLIEEVVVNGALSGARLSGNFLQSVTAEATFLNGVVGCLDELQSSRGAYRDSGHVSISCVATEASKRGALCLR